MARGDPPNHRILLSWIEMAQCLWSGAETEREVEEEEAPTMENGSKNTLACWRRSDLSDRSGFRFGGLKTPAGPAA